MATSSSLHLLHIHPLPRKPTSGISKGSHFRVTNAAAASSSAAAPVKVARDDQSSIIHRGGVDTLTPLYEDGYGRAGLRDYYDAAREVIGAHGGPPRWFCPVDGGPAVSAAAPLFFYLPDIDGIGMGLILHHKPLGKIFEVRCLNIPLDDRTPFEGLVKFVEESVKNEHALCPNRPIYLLGDSFGGCLALAVAARNPSIDLVLILVNPATSYNKSMLHPYIPILEALAQELRPGISNALNSIIDGPLKMATAWNVEDLPLQGNVKELAKNISSLVPLLSELIDTLPNDTLLWKLKLLKSGAAYSNSRLHAVDAQVLMLASGNDRLLPNGDEADRLWASLRNCKVRYFKNSGHSLLLENEINLLTVIKGTRTYRRSRHFDFVTDYLPLTAYEFRKMFLHGYELFRHAVSPVFFSTLENGKIVRGLSGVPNKGPVLLVGYHMLMGLEAYFIAEQFLKEKDIVIRSLAHPYLAKKSETSRQEFGAFDGLVCFGGLPVSGINIFKLFANKSFILLFPGGSREAHHRKGEDYKLFWPEQPEFVRMAARFGATIVPFGTVGEDDLGEIVMDYDDQTKISFLKQWIEDFNREASGINIRADAEGEIANQDMYVPVISPKVPGRFYYLFGKPIETRGTSNLKDRDSANELYLRIKSEVEGLISYLKEKREEDPYRSLIQRTMYLNSSGSSSQVPTFEL